MKKYAFILLFVFSVTISYAAPRDNLNIPLPSGSRAHLSQNIGEGQMEVKINAYKTYLLPEEVLAFYKAQMRRRGWVEDTRFAESLRDVPLQVGLDNSQQQAVRLKGNKLKFTKKEDMVLIIVVPRRASSQSTTFTIFSGKGPSAGSMEFNPAKKMDFAPVYPNSKLTFSRNSTYIYTAQANAQDVVSFYRIKLPDYGWRVVNESSLKEQRMDFPADTLKQGDTFDYNKCPDCPQVKNDTGLPVGDMQGEAKAWIAGMIKDMKIVKGGLTCSSPKKGKLEITFAQALSGSDTPVTRIIMSFNEN